MAGPLAEAVARLNQAADSMKQVGQQAGSLSERAEQTASMVAAVYAGLGSAGGPTVAAIQTAQQKLKEALSAAHQAAAMLTQTAARLASGAK